MFPSTGSDNANIITIVGREESVKKVKTELEATIKSLNEQVTDEVEVDPKWHKNFTARRGKIINKISEENCNTKISFPRASTANIVTIKGPKDAVIATKNRILEVVYEFENQITLEVVIPQKYHMTVIGKKGVNIQQISEDCRVEIQFPARLQTNEVDEVHVDDLGDEPPVASKLDIVLVSGLKSECEKAKDALLALIPVQEDIDLPNEFHINLLSNKANILREISNDHNVQVIVPKRGTVDGMNHVTLIGLKENNEEVKELLKQKVKEFEEEKLDRELRNFKVELDIKPEYIQVLRGKNGIEVTKLNEKFDVKINFSKKGEPDRVIIRGYEKNAYDARDEIEARLAQYASKITQEVEIDSRVHSRIIGAQGKNLKKITDKFKVEVKFSGRNSSSPDTVSVIGDDADAVDDACDFLKNMEEEYLQDITDRDAYRHPSKVDNRSEKPVQSSKGFIVKGAPWDQTANVDPIVIVPDTSNFDDFPTITCDNNENNTIGSKSSWGPRR